MAGFDPAIQEEAARAKALERLRQSFRLPARMVGSGPAMTPARLGAERPRETPAAARRGFRHCWLGGAGRESASRSRILWTRPRVGERYAAAGRRASAAAGASPATPSVSCQSFSKTPTARSASPTAPACGANGSTWEISGTRMRAAAERPTRAISQPGGRRPAKRARRSSQVAPLNVRSTQPFHALCSSSTSDGNAAAAKRGQGSLID